MLNPRYGISFQELYEREGLAKLDSVFLEHVKVQDVLVHEELLDARASPVSGILESELLLKLAPFLESFFIELFQVQSQIADATLFHEELEVLFECKKNFIQRRVAKQCSITREEILEQLPQAKAILKSNGFDFESDVRMAQKIMYWSAVNEELLLNAALIYSAFMVHISKDSRSILFALPQKTDYADLAKCKSTLDGGKSLDGVLRNRLGFSLNDAGITTQESIGQSKYCIHCHKQGKDSCSKGIRDKMSGTVLQNPLGIDMDGCPLDEKISEMNYLRAQGFLFAPLAIVIIDNPMLAATGHRICNACMKSCIYQKQEPVNVPLIETEILQTILALPYGFEIYSLLTKWNPMNLLQWLPAMSRDEKVLVVGLGPAGFTLAHYLLNQGVTVVAIDGLKIEPLPHEVSGIDQNGVRHAFIPIENVQALYDNLDDRVAFGFGGVTEYGITSRWDKNYLKVIRMLLERRSHFRMYGGVRFGSNITFTQGQGLGFDHIALALGAGSPNLLAIDNNMANGVRTASDFMMALQLSGAARYDSLSNLQIELPIVVIGGGLTAVDAATESLNYYARQVEKALIHYELLGADIFSGLSVEERALLEKFLEHARILKEYPERKAELLRQWGGVKILYRKSMSESPSYRLNHEELVKALEEGVEFVENIVPLAIEVDELGHCTAVRHENGLIIARAILLALGTKPNTVLTREDPANFSLEDSYFQVKSGSDYSVFGDLHPKYRGNVANAMASAKHGYPSIMAKLDQGEPLNKMPAQAFFTQLDSLLLARILKVERLTDNIVEVRVQSQLAAKNFQPGQFYRLQNYESNAVHASQYKYAMEPIALTGAIVDKEEGVLSMIALEMGGSSNFCQYLKENEIVSLMGPTGTPTIIPEKEKVLLIGGGLGNAVLFSIGQAMKRKKCTVLYFAGYKESKDRYKELEIEKAADVVVWCCDNSVLTKNRTRDFSLRCNLVEAIAHYAQAVDTTIKLHEIDRVIVIGSDIMMAAVAYACHNQFRALFKKDVITIGSINSPMQCMMKEICAQCLQLHTDEHGKSYHVYSCFEQDQDLSTVDFNCLKNRLAQNALVEKIASKVISHVLK